VAERKPEANSRCPAAAGHEGSRRAIDRHDVIGIETMTYAQRVGQQREAKEHRLLRSGGDEKTSCDQVEYDDGYREDHYGW
jgi:hypothetical protein